MNTHGIEDCYRNAKRYQKKKSTKLSEKTGYELVSVITDKMIKQNFIFTVSKPTPYEADLINKVWADIFEVLFFNTGIHIQWGEKCLTCVDDDYVLFKLDAKFVLIYDETEYSISSAEFAQYCEAKAIYNEVMGMDISEENKDLLRITNIQIMGLEVHTLSLNTASDQLYVANSVKSYTLPSTVSKLKTQSKSIIGDLFDFKHFTLNTADIIKQGPNDKKITKKSMKRKMEEDPNHEETPLTSKRKLTSVWRHKKNA